LSLADAISSFATGTYNVTRPTPGTTTGGVYQEGATQSFVLTGCVQPLGSRDLLRLPEGERSRERVKLYTTTELRVATAGGSLSDRVVYRGATYEVESVEPWDELGGFFTIVLRKMGQ
jgi:hypothetical protein